MGKCYLLTDEVMQNAVAYMPIEAKVRFAKAIAKKCIENIPTATQNIGGENFLALPYIQGENRELKAMCLMTVLLSYYLKIETKEPFTEEIYNYYAGGSLLNQIERYKSVSTFRDKAFDLLTDYKEFRKFVDIEINNLVAVSNDLLARFVAAISVYSSPENIKKAMEELEKVGKDYKSSSKSKKNLLKGEKTNDTITKEEVTAETINNG